MPRLPRAVWTLEAGALVNAFGSGIAFPFLIIYLHNVRGFGLGTAGLVVSAIGVAAAVAGPASGPLLDRIGGRATLAASLLVSAAAYAAVPLIHHPWQAFLFRAVNGVFVGVIALNVAYITAGYATFELLPAFAKNESHVSERWIGLIFFASTLALVAAQLPVARFAEGRRRMAVLAAMPALFTGAWLVI